MNAAAFGKVAVGRLVALGAAVAVIAVPTSVVAQGWFDGPLPPSAETVPGPLYQQTRESLPAPASAAPTSLLPPPLYGPDRTEPLVAAPSRIGPGPRPSLQGAGYPSPVPGPAAPTSLLPPPLAPPAPAQAVESGPPPPPDTAARPVRQGIAEWLATLLSARPDSQAGPRAGPAVEPRFESVEAVEVYRLQPVPAVRESSFGAPPPIAGPGQGAAGERPSSIARDTPGVIAATPPPPVRQAARQTAPASAAERSVDEAAQPTGPPAAVQPGGAEIAKLQSGPEVEQPSIATPRPRPKPARIAHPARIEREDGPPPVPADPAEAARDGPPRLEVGDTAQPQPVPAPGERTIAAPRSKPASLRITPPAPDNAEKTPPAATPEAGEVIMAASPPPARQAPRQTSPAVVVGRSAVDEVVSQPEDANGARLQSGAVAEKPATTSVRPRPKPAQTASPAGTPLEDSPPRAPTAPTETAGAAPEPDPQETGGRAAVQIAERSDAGAVADAASRRKPAAPRASAKAEEEPPTAADEAVGVSVAAPPPRAPTAPTETASAAPQPDPQETGGTAAVRIAERPDAGAVADAAPAASRPMAGQTAGPQPEPGTDEPPAAAPRPKPATPQLARPAQRKTGQKPKLAANSLWDQMYFPAGPHRGGLAAARSPSPRR